MKESEIKIIRHIQSAHPEKQLCVDAGSPNKLICFTEESYSETIRSNVNENNKERLFNQDDVFYPCSHDDCPDIFLTLEELRNHSSSHGEKRKRKEVKTGCYGGDKQKHGTHLKTSIRSNHHEKIRNVTEYKCPVCTKVYSHKHKGSHGTFKNHVVSHFYSVIYPHLPKSKPYKCPLCINPKRDIVTLARHYALGHKKLFELTDVTPKDLYYI